MDSALQRRRREEHLIGKQAAAMVAAGERAGGRKGWGHALSPAG
jgi:hypothetical protein